MRTIWKYQITPCDRFTLEMPEGAALLTVQLQNGEPTIWAAVLTTNQKVKYRFAVIGTGNPLPEDIGARDYVGTWQQGPFVWHLFEVPW